jgi:hypothetical protein
MVWPTMQLHRMWLSFSSRSWEEIWWQCFHVIVRLARIVVAVWTFSGWVFSAVLCELWHGESSKRSVDQFLVGGGLHMAFWTILVIVRWSFVVAEKLPGDSLFWHWWHYLACSLPKEARQSKVEERMELLGYKLPTHLQVGWLELAQIKKSD